MHPAAQLVPVKADRLHGVDLMIVRELTGGIYFGKHTRDAEQADDVCRYTVAEIERVMRARPRSGAAALAHA